MRDAYILDLATRRVGGLSAGERLLAAADTLNGLQQEALGGKRPISWVGVASSDGAIARSLGLLAGLSATVCAQDTAAGSGLSGLAAAARAVTSGFESVAASVAIGPSCGAPTWPDALRARFTPVAPKEAQAMAMRRAELEPNAVREALEARRERLGEQGHDLVALGGHSALPEAPDAPGVAAVLLAGHTEIREHGWKTRARITSVVQTGLDPALGPAAAAQAAQTALHRLHLRADELDFIQVDARMAAAPSIVGKALGLADAQINPGGGALCWGGAGAASGLVDLELLLRALETDDRRFGLVVGLEPMGGATAVVVDRQFYM